jgi:uncharacterized protein (TIGR02118 family)
MSSKLVVLYPQPIDADAFEKVYHAKHMPLVRSHVTAPGRTPTYRVRLSTGAKYYRMAEIHFDSHAELEAFVSSQESREGRSSAEAVSTGGPPLFLLCEQDPS